MSSFLKELEKQLRAHYDEMISNAVARVFEDKELYKPMVRMSGLSRGKVRCIYDNNPKWTRKKECQTMVIDGVTLYDKRAVNTDGWKQYER